MVTGVLLMKKTRYLLMSDLHIGSGRCNIAAVIERIEEHCPETIIIVGDLFEEGVVNNGEMDLVQYLLRNHKKVVRIDGNHDDSYHLPGIDMIKELHWQIGNKRFCAIHGHRLDPCSLIFGQPAIDRFFLLLISLLRMVGFLGYNLSDWLDKYHREFSENLAKKAIKFAARRRIKADVIICGHTHQPMERTVVVKGRKVHYYNLGSCLDGECSYGTIDEDGNFQLHVVPNQNKSNV